MGEGFIRFRHAMCIFTFLHGTPSILRRLKEFASQLLFHALFRALPRRLDKPAHSQGIPPNLAYFNRHLVGRTTNPT